MWPPTNNVSPLVIKLVDKTPVTLVTSTINHSEIAVLWPPTFPRFRTGAPPEYLVPPVPIVETHFGS